MWLRGKKIAGGKLKREGDDGSFLNASAGLFPRVLQFKKERDEDVVASQDRATQTACSCKAVSQHSVRCLCNSFSAGTVMWCGPTTALSESCSVNFGFFVGIVDIQVALRGMVSWVAIRNVF